VKPDDFAKSESPFSELLYATETMLLVTAGDLEAVD
jgi:hypothetical protein